MKWIIRIGLLAVLLGAGFYQWQVNNRPLAPQLVSVNNDKRTMAISKIEKLSMPRRQETMQQILAFQNDSDARVRRYALYALRTLSVPSPEVFSFGMKALIDPDKSVQEEAQAVLGRFGEAVIPTLIGSLAETQGDQLQAVIQVLARMDNRVIPSLIEVLKSPTVKAHIPALMVLKQIGKPASDASPVAQVFLASSDAGARLAAAEFLVTINNLPGNVISPLSQDLLTAKDSYKDPMAIRPRLAQLLELADKRRRTLIDLGFDLKQKNPALRYRAAYVLSEMNPPNVGSMEMLVDALEDADVYVASRAMVALARMGLDKTERIKKIANPRMRSATRRAQAAQIEGFNDIVLPALKNIAE